MKEFVGIEVVLGFVSFPGLGLGSTQQKHRCWGFGFKFCSSKTFLLRAAGVWGLVGYANVPVVYLVAAAGLKKMYH
jgi:hypothetical protein